MTTDSIQVDSELLLNIYVEVQRPKFLNQAEIAELADIPENDILYFSHSNEAMAHLPYMVCLAR